jgi:hypothetical protein
MDSTRENWSSPSSSWAARRFVRLTRTTWLSATTNAPGSAVHVLALRRSRSRDSVDHTNSSRPPTGNRCHTLSMLRHPAHTLAISESVSCLAG